MQENSLSATEFTDRFLERKNAERYRDRYRSGRHARINELEQNSLRKLLSGLGNLDVALDLPSGTGRLAGVLGEYADRVILADTSPVMLEFARANLGDAAEYLRTNAEAIGLPAESVDLVFCHRLLNHVPDPGVRARIMTELARVSRRYVVVSCYPPGLRTRFKVFIRTLFGSTSSRRERGSLDEYIELAVAAGLRLAGRSRFRRPPYTAEFVLFERS